MHIIILHSPLVTPSMLPWCFQPGDMSVVQNPEPKSSVISILSNFIYSISFFCNILNIIIISALKHIWQHLILRRKSRTLLDTVHLCHRHGLSAISPLEGSRFSFIHSPLNYIVSSVDDLWFCSFGLSLFLC